MGLLVNGAWQEDISRTKDGHFIRPTTRFRNFVTADGSAGPTGEGGFAAEAGRYHLYVSLACPWAHRTLIFRSLKKLENAISVSVTAPLYGKTGWEFGTARGGTRDEVNGKATLAEIYLLADPHYTGRVSVPVLWDKKRRTIVNNESSEIIRMLNSAFDAFTNVHTDYYPAELRAEIDRINDIVYPNVNNGVYRAGFATSQEAYEEAARAIFATFDQLEERLSRQRYLAGQRDHRSGLAAVHHADPFRHRLLQPFQMQSAARRGLSQSVELSARSLSGAGRRRDRQHRSHQAALLRQPAPGQSDRHRADRSADRLHRTARPRHSVNHNAKSQPAAHHSSAGARPLSTSAMRSRVARDVSSGKLCRSQRSRARRFRCSAAAARSAGTSARYRARRDRAATLGD